MTTRDAWMALAGQLMGCVAVCAAQQPVFRSTVNLVAVDVLVVDRDGQPHTGLGVRDFDVSIDGRRRRVESAEFLQYLSRSEMASRPGVSSAVRASNDWPVGAPPRTFVIAIDTSSFTAGESAHVLQSARAFVDRLSALDLVGVQTLPHGPTLAPTADHAAVRRTLQSVVGMQAMRPGQFHLTPAEVIDITAADGVMQSGPRPPGRGAAAGSAPGDTNDALRQVQMRECRSATDQGCLAGILAEADAINRQFDDEAEETLSSLDRVINGLAAYPARRTIVLLSAGMPVSDRQGNWHSDGGRARRIGQTAARANATIYALHVDRGYSDVFSAEARRPRQDITREREVEQMLLSELAETSGGTLLWAPTASADPALARLLRETSAYYLLAVAPEPRDFDGRSHQLRVKTTAKSVDVRSRLFVHLPRSR